MKTVRILFSTLAICGLSFAQAPSPHAERLNEAAAVLDEIMAVKDKGIPQELLDKAHCALVVPGMKKGAFVIGGQFGRGFVSCRQADGTGWSAPAPMRVEGGSVGFQIGGSETDFVMLIMNARGAERLIKSSKFSVGGEASAAAGPVGRTSSAETDASMRAEMLTYSRSRGAFAGISLKGGTIRADDEAIGDLYGNKKMKNEQIIYGKTPAPAAAAKFLATLNKYSSRLSK
jgi:lipid-binding SYLF domain-containing protein